MRRNSYGLDIYLQLLTYRGIFSQWGNIKGSSCQEQHDSDMKESSISYFLLQIQTLLGQEGCNDPGLGKLFHFSFKSLKMKIYLFRDEGLRIPEGLTVQVL